MADQFVFSVLNGKGLGPVLFLELQYPGCLWTLKNSCGWNKNIFCKWEKETEVAVENAAVNIVLKK